MFFIEDIFKKRDSILFLPTSDAKSHEKTVLLTFHSVLTDSTSPAERIIELGCIKSSTQTKKV